MPVRKVFEPAVTVGQGFVGGVERFDNGQQVAMVIHQLELDGAEVVGVARDRESGRGGDAGRNDRLQPVPLRQLRGQITGRIAQRHEGGELVYSYAGGVGTRSGDTTDVNNLVKAALYNRAALSRTQKNEAGAAAGFAELAAKFPEDQTIQIMGAESLVIDTKDYAGALTALAKIPQPADTARTYRRYLLAKVDAYIGAGKKDSAKAILEPLVAKAPNNKALQTRMEKLK